MNKCMFTFEELLLKLSLCDLNLNGLVDLLSMSALVVRIVLDCRREEGIDECSLPQARFSSDLSNCQIMVSIDHRVQGVTIIVKAAPLLATILCLRNPSQPPRPRHTIELFREIYLWFGSCKHGLLACF